MSESNPFLARQQQHDEGKTRCGLCKQVLGQSKTRIKQYHDAITNEDITLEVVRDVLSDWGVKTSVTTLSDHRQERSTHSRCMERLRKAVS